MQCLLVVVAGLDDRVRHNPEQQLTVTVTVEGGVSGIARKSSPKASGDSVSAVRESRDPAPPHVPVSQDPPPVLVSKGAAGGQFLDPKRTAAEDARLAKEHLVQLAYPEVSLPAPRVGTELGLDLTENDAMCFKLAREPWALEHYETPHLGVPVFSLADADLTLGGGGRPGERFDDETVMQLVQFPVKIPGSDEMWMPQDLGEDTAAVHALVQQAHAYAKLLYGEEMYDQYYSYLGIRQRSVKTGEQFRGTPFAHYDGWSTCNGPRDPAYPEISFHIASGGGTLEFGKIGDAAGGGFTYKSDDPWVEWQQMQPKAQEAIDQSREHPDVVYTEPEQTLLFMDSYTLHSEPIRFPANVLRTFIRITFATNCWGSYDSKANGDPHGNSVNEHFAEHFRTTEICNPANVKEAIINKREFDLLTAWEANSVVWVNTRTAARDYLDIHGLQDLQRELEAMQQELKRPLNAADPPSPGVRKLLDQALDKLAADAEVQGRHKLFELRQLVVGFKVAEASPDGDADLEQKIQAFLATGQVPEA